MDPVPVADESCLFIRQSFFKLVQTWLVAQHDQEITCRNPSISGRIEDHPPVGPAKRNDDHIYVAGGKQRAQGPGRDLIARADTYLLHCYLRTNDTHCDVEKLNHMRP